jgi:hypothetical protein
LEPILCARAVFQNWLAKKNSSPAVGPAWRKSTNRYAVVFSITTIVRPPPSPEADANEAPPIAIATSAPTPAVMSSLRSMRIPLIRRMLPNGLATTDATPVRATGQAGVGLCRFYFGRRTTKVSAFVPWMIVIVPSAPV